VPPARILLLTFSRRASREMTRRARRIVGQALADQGRGEVVKLPWAGTFHSVANRLLREYAANLGLDPGFSVLDRGDAGGPDGCRAARSSRSVSRSRRFPRKDTCLVDLLALRERTRRPGRLPRRGLAVVCRVGGRAAPAVSPLRGSQAGWQHARLRRPAACGGTACWNRRRLRPWPSASASITCWSTNTRTRTCLQAEILLRLKPDGRGLTVVGDDAQSIYSFRAADVENILRFPAQFAPPAEIVMLEQNYRSVQPVLDSANALMRAGGAAVPQGAPLGEAVRAAAVLCHGAGRRGPGRLRHRRPMLAARETGQLLRRQAVLFRASHHSDRLELELVRRNIPFVKYGGLEVSRGRACQGPAGGAAVGRQSRATASLRFAACSCCLGSARLRRPGPSAGWRRMVSRRRRSPTGAPPPAAAPYWARASSSCWPVSVGARATGTCRSGSARDWYRPQLERLYEEWPVRLGDLEALEQIAGKFATREQFLTELSLDPPQATGDLAGPPLLDEDYLVLSTIHSAKGQEWDAVYVLNVADGNFPSEFATGKPALIEEERRLLYVAMTRAKSALHLVAPLKYWVPQQPRHGDRHVYGARSRFIDAAMMGLHGARFHGVTEAGRARIVTAGGSDRRRRAAEGDVVRRGE
jgi:DNA helicase II / ATP-dependent DNA helicase PcrA